MRILVEGIARQIEELIGYYELPIDDEASGSVPELIVDHPFVYSHSANSVLKETYDWLSRDVEHGEVGRNESRDEIITLR